MAQRLNERSLRPLGMLNVIHAGAIGPSLEGDSHRASGPQIIGCDGPEPPVELVALLPDHTRGKTL